MASFNISDISAYLASLGDAGAAYRKATESAKLPVGELILAIGMAGVHEDTEKVFEPFLNSGGRANGRAGSNVPDVPAAVAAPTSLTGETVYVRPNGEKYYSRQWGEHNDVMVLRKAQEKMHFPLMYGAPGCGKTALVEAAFGDKLYTIMGTGDTEVSDFVGSWIQTPDGLYQWIDGPLVRAAEEGAVLLIDEIGLIDPKVLSLAYGLMDGRRELFVTSNPERGTVKAADGFFVVAATNPNAPGVRLSEALLSRFSLHVEMTTDWALARKLGVENNVVTAAQNLAKQVETNACSWAPQFRELIAYRDLARDFGAEFALRNMVAAAPEQERDTVMVALSNATAMKVFPAKI